MQSQSRTAMILHVVMFCCGKILTFEKQSEFLGVSGSSGGPGGGLS